MQVSTTILNEGCSRFGAEPGKTNPRGGEEAALYQTQIGEKRYMLRFSPVAAFDSKAPVRLDEIWKFIDYLARGGAHVAQPVKSTAGNLIEWIDEPTGRSRWALVCVEWVDGGPLDATRLNQYAAPVLRSWGRLMGRMHLLTKSYTEETSLHGWEEESASFLAQTKERGVAAKWEEMISQLTKFPRDADSYGLVHNDLHSMNVVANGETVTAVDFDDAGYHWFACDIAIAMQAVLWTTPNGVATSMPSWRQVYRTFMNGYREENNLDSMWEKEIPTFLAYRRLLLHTVFSSVWKRPGAWQRDRLAVWRDGILTDRPVIGPVAYKAES
jgi:Ser/Thr protein kinase RdoA (MazF antagonist)